MSIAARDEESVERSGHPAGARNLLGRKSVLMGMAASMGFAFANAASPSAAAADTLTFAPNWTPFTAYPFGQQVITPSNDVVSANVTHKSSAAYANDTAKWTLSATYVAQTLAQTTEGIAVPVFTVTPKTTGAPPFQVQQNSFPNSGAGAGTENHAVHVGWNAACHSSGPGVVTGKAAMLMGFEDNYYDNGGTNKYGTEFYVEYWSPDGTSQQMRRPFYARVLDSNTNGAFNCPIRMDVGIGDFAIGGEAGTLFSVSDGAQLSTLNTTAFNFTGATLNHVPAANAQAIFTIESPNPVFRFRTSGVLLWEIVATATSFVVCDSNVRANMTLTYGASAAAAVSTFDSNLVTTQSLSTPAVIGNGGANRDLYLRTGTGAGTMTFYDATLTAALTITSAGNLIVKERSWLASAGTAGFTLGNNTIAKMGFWGKTPVVQQARPTDAASIITLLTTLGLCE